MSQLPQQATASQSQVPALRRLKPWASVLACVVVFGGFLWLDGLRPPGRQLSSRAYIGLVRVYQQYGRPVTRKFVKCRYVPTCSEYSVEAFQKYGFFRGLKLTAKRLTSCRRSVPLGTRDPVP